jgi:phytol kinase
VIARELSRVLLVAGGLAAILAFAEGLRRAGQRTEITRKLVHVASGLMAAAFPWLFESPWSVVALAGGYAGLMAWTLRTRRLASVHAVRRHSSGGLYYSLAVAVVFALVRERPEVYVASILVLALGDAAAALAGRAVGRHRYRAPGGR